MFLLQMLILVHSDGFHLICLASPGNVYELGLVSTCKDGSILGKHCTGCQSKLHSSD